ncbi:MAG: hypothetical protein ACJA13_002813 [Paraglaciecola sp.]
MNKSLSILVFLAVLAVAAGYWVQSREVVPQADKAPLLPGLDTQANGITQIELSNASGVLFQAKRSNEQWLANVQDAQGQVIGRYPVAKDKLGALVSALAEARQIEAKTAKKSNYHHLGVQDLTATDSLATLVSLRSDKLSWQVLVGNHATVGNGSYVRLPQSKQAWLVDKSLALPLTNNVWLKQPILPFEDADFSKIARVDQSPWLIQRADANAQFTLASMAQDRQLKYGGVLEAMAINLASLNFDALITPDTLQWNKLTDVVELNVTTFYGHSFTVELAKGNDKVYLRISSALTKDYWLQWIYVISTFAAEQLDKTQNDFLMPAPDDKPASITPAARAVDEGESPF